MIDRLKLILKDECGVTTDLPILVGVSGGADSVGLLHSLFRLGYPLVIAHLDHRLRTDSAHDRMAVEQIADRLGVQCVSEEIDVSDFAVRQKMSLEEGAREVRYRFLFRVADSIGAQAVAVGHTADDQVETVLMHLLRGSGLAGLRGMNFRSLPNPWSDELPLIRPLLGVWRNEIMGYLEQMGIQYVNDVSNLDTRFYRNRLRHELIPYLEGFNPQVRAIIWRMAYSLKDDFDLVETQVETAWNEIFIEGGDGYVGFNHSQLKHLHVGVQRHLLRYAIYSLMPGLRDLDFENLNRAVGFVKTPLKTGHIELVAGLNLLLEDGVLWLADSTAVLPTGQWPQVWADQVAYLPVPGMICLPEGWVLRAEIETDNDMARSFVHGNQDANLAWIDGRNISYPLVIRSRRPGDRFHPLGMQGHSTKLSDFMVNVKIPRRARKNWPLVLSNEEIVWIPGVRLADQFQVQESSDRIVRLSIVKSG